MQSLFDRELSLLTGTSKQGLGNWKKIAEHIGTRTKEEVETHYRAVYIDSPSWPLPVRALIYAHIFIHPNSNPIILAHGRGI